MTDLRPIDRWDGGIGWLADPDEAIQRASHALVGDDGVWVVDPVDAPGVDDLLADLGDVTGIVLGIDRHKRDAAALAARHDVRVHLAAPLGEQARSLDAPTTVFDGELGDSGFRARTVVATRFWTEVALWSGATRTLLLPEAVGTAPHYVLADERLGVHPALRLRPPRRALGGFAPDRLLVGHGTGIHDGADEALERALATARWTAPRLYLRAAYRVLPWR